MKISYNQANLYNHSPLDTGMNIKKLIAAVVFALGAWMSVGAVQAQTTNYDFSSNGQLLDTLGYVYGTFQTNSSGDVTSGTIYSNGNQLVPYAVLGNYLTNTVTFVVSPDWLRIYGPQTLVNGNNLSVQSSYSSGTITCTSGCPSSGAPEIDGSLAPKVGFLLGCLFLMFGRKKQDSEPMMTAYVNLALHTKATFVVAFLLPKFNIKLHNACNPMFLSCIQIYLR